MLNNNNGKLLVDTQPIVSKSVDVELKCNSQCKQGKEGHIVDCIAYSINSIISGTNSRVKGDKQENNDIVLIGHLSQLTHLFHSI